MKTRQPATFTLAPLRAITPNGTKLRPAAFRVVFGGNVFHLDSADQKVTRDAWKAFLNLRRLT